MENMLRRSPGAFRLLQAALILSGLTGPLSALHIVPVPVGLGTLFIALVLVVAALVRDNRRRRELQQLTARRMSDRERREARVRFR